MEGDGRRWKAMEGHSPALGLVAIVSNVHAALLAVVSDDAEGGLERPSLPVLVPAPDATADDVGCCSALEVRERCEICVQCQRGALGQQRLLLELHRLTIASPPAFLANQSHPPGPVGQIVAVAAALTWDSQVICSSITFDSSRRHCTFCTQRRLLLRWHVSAAVTLGNEGRTETVSLLGRFFFRDP